MKIRIIPFYLIFALLFFTSQDTFAEIIALKSGQTLDKKIVERTPEYIKIDFYGTRLTFYANEIYQIDGKEFKAAGLQEVKKERALISSEDLKDKMVLALSAIENYAFSESIISRTITTKNKQLFDLNLTANSEGIMDAGNQTLYLKSSLASGEQADLDSGSKEIYIIKGMVYQKEKEGWLKAPVNQPQDYFKVIVDQLEVIRASDYEIIKENPLHIKLIPDKKLVIGKILGRALSQQPGLLEKLLVNFDKILELAEMEYWFDAEYRIKRVSSRVIALLNQETLRAKDPKEILPAELIEGTRVEVITRIKIDGYNQQPPLALPPEAYLATAPDEPVEDLNSIRLRSQENLQ